MRDQLDSILRSVTVSVAAMRNGSIRRAMVAYLERDEFLAGVTGSPIALREAERVATARLG